MSAQQSGDIRRISAATPARCVVILSSGLSIFDAAPRTRFDAASKCRLKTVTTSLSLLGKIAYNVAFEHWIFEDISAMVASRKPSANMRSCSRSRTSSLRASSTRRLEGAVDRRRTGVTRTGDSTSTAFLAPPPTLRGYFHKEHGTEAAQQRCRFARSPVRINAEFGTFNLDPWQAWTATTHVPRRARVWRGCDRPTSKSLGVSPTMAR